MSYKNRNNTSALWGKRRRERRADEMKKMQLEADIEKQKLENDIKAKNAGLISDNEIKKEETTSNTQMYLILGAVLAFIVGIAVYFKFRKK